MFDIRVIISMSFIIFFLYNFRHAISKLSHHALLLILSLFLYSNISHLSPNHNLAEGIYVITFCSQNHTKLGPINN